MQEGVKRVRKVKHLTPSTTYYKSAHWKQFTKNYWLTHDRCVICGALKFKETKEGQRTQTKRKFVVHHKNYKHLWSETEDDVLGCCANCHNMCHDILRRRTAESPMWKEVQEIVKLYFPYDKGDNHE